MANSLLTDPMFRVRLPRFLWLRRKWFRATHVTIIRHYDPPRHTAGSYFTIQGSMITSRRGWYRRYRRIMFGVNA